MARCSFQPLQLQGRARLRREQGRRLHLQARRGPLRQSSGTGGALICRERYTSLDRRMPDSAMAYTPYQSAGPSRFIGIGVVVLLHAVIIYALVTALAH